VNNPKTALLTAGLEPKNFIRAAARLVNDAKKLYRFSEFIVLNTDSLAKYCPEVAKVYPTFLNSAVKGFGFWSWKPELIYRVAKGEFGCFDQVIWIDAGCEINSNLVSRRIFEHRILEADRIGYWFHALNSNEFQYSKMSVISKFPQLTHSNLISPQIQANYMHFSSKLSLPLLREWYLMTVETISNLDLTSSKTGDSQFIEHRSDQSLLSLVAKSHSYSHSRINLPNGRSAKSKIAGMFEPVWITRNRSGKSIVPPIMSRLP
jgi:hypothetical protein